MNIKKILLFGSGMVSMPVIDFFLKDCNYQLTVVTNDNLVSKNLLQKYPNNLKVIVTDISNHQLCNSIIKDNDIVLSLLPANLHFEVSKMSLEQNKHFLTSSYLSPTLLSLNKQVCEKNLTFLNEVGLDPGIDHIVTLKMINDIRKRGGKIESLESYCGGLITPDCVDNPLAYKFSWSPIGVFRALSNDSVYLKNNKIISIPGKDLLYSAKDYKVNNALNIVVYPNRDSLKYKDLYGIPEAHSVIRGTFRYKGFCEAVSAFKDLGFLVETVPEKNISTWIDLIKQNINKNDIYDNNLINLDILKNEKINSIMSEIGIDRNFIISVLKNITKHQFYKNLSKTELINRICIILETMLFFGFLQNSKKLEPKISILENFIKVIEPPLRLNPTDSDSVIMTIVLEAIFPKENCKEEYKFQMIINGERGGISAMAKTVGLPLSIATHLLANKNIQRSGVIGPFTEDIYTPMYNELVNRNIIPKFKNRIINSKL